MKTKRKRPLVHGIIRLNIFDELCVVVAGLSLANELREAGFKLGDLVTIALSPNHSKARRRKR